MREKLSFRCANHCSSAGRPGAVSCVAPSAATAEAFRVIGVVRVHTETCRSGDARHRPMGKRLGVDGWAASPPPGNARRTTGCRTAKVCRTLARRAYMYVYVRGPAVRHRLDNIIIIV